VDRAQPYVESAARGADRTARGGRIGDLREIFFKKIFVFLFFYFFNILG